ncbi:MAG: hypothetical protein OH338_04170 [Candidatus Parvarchaeota archaeon]|nr:hypothetical protein [Candidatus Parvarchaeota archaeon]MCW1295471.1 hypothetical protein [Candidatus Parvarchaeum tengchongense]MCW1299160.1 hypothetical protein [Candidatus Parvarchaeum tengchongense]MCW1312592.1 hypothetical protein [Candidatus Parvarchaeum tengchongense]
MTNILYVMINSMIQTDPYIAYLFFAMIIAGVGITYFYRKEVGFIITIIISIILGYMDILYPFIYLITAVCAVLLVLSLFGGGSITRPIKNLESWIYIKIMLKKQKK